MNVDDRIKGAAEPQDAESLLRMSPADRSEAIDLISRIKELRDTLRPAEQRVADIVLRDIEFAVHASSNELARRAGVSEPTVTRFSRALGCTGVREFKVKLAQSLIVGTMYFRDPKELIGDDTADLPFVDVVVGHARGALDHVERQLDRIALAAAINAIVQAERVIVMGVGGGSTSVAQDMQYRLFRYGINVTAYSDVYLMRMVAATLNAKDVVIAISATGRTQEVLGPAEVARQYNAQVIALTQPGSALARAADIALTVDVPESANVLKPTASRYAFMLLVDLIATGTAYSLGGEAQETLRRIKHNVMNFRQGEVLEPLGD